MQKTRITGVLSQAYNYSLFITHTSQCHLEKRQSFEFTHENSNVFQIILQCYVQEPGLTFRLPLCTPDVCVCVRA